MKGIRRTVVSALVVGALAGAALGAAPAACYAASSAQHAVKAVDAGVKTGSAEAAAHPDPSEDAQAHSDRAHKPGLPQLNPEYFPGQIFWLLVNFFVLYVIMAYVALPGVKVTQDARRRTIRHDLSEARAASEAAHAAQALSDKVMGEAHLRAVTAVASIKSSAAAESSERQESLQRELARRIRGAEMNISRARVAALKEVHDVAAGVIAAEIIGKVAGISVDPSHLTLTATDGGQGRA